MIIGHRWSYPQISSDFLCVMHNGAVATVPLFPLKVWFFIILSLKLRPLSSCPMGTTCYLKRGVDWKCVCTSSEPGGLPDHVFKPAFIWKGLCSSLPDLLYKTKGSTVSGDNWESGFESWLLVQRCWCRCPKVFKFGPYCHGSFGSSFKCTDCTTACFQTLSFDNLFVDLMKWAPSLSSLQQYEYSPRGPQLTPLFPTAEEKKSIWKHFSLVWQSMENECSLQTKLICRCDEPLQQERGGKNRWKTLKKSTKRKYFNVVLIQKNHFGFRLNTPAKPSAPGLCVGRR